MAQSLMQHALSACARATVCGHAARLAGLTVHASLGVWTGRPFGQASDASAPTTVWPSSQQRRSYSHKPELHVTVEPLADQHEGISVVSLNRHAAKNAIGRQLLRELVEAMTNLRQERTTRVVILRSTVPGVFSAGADLKERAGMTHIETEEFVGSLRRAMSDLQALPMPTIAAIEGLALGGGAELALASDMRVVSSTSAFSFPECQLGIIPGAGGTQRLPRLVGMSRAKELIFTGRRVAGPEAVQLGLADYCVEDGKAYSRALEIAVSITKCAPLSLRMAKSAINCGMDVDLGTGLRMEEAYYAQLIPTRDRREGLAAFAEKRPPQWQGE